MDAEDLGEFGIAHQNLRATSTFATADSRKRKFDAGGGSSAISSTSNDPLTRMWEGMITPASESIGTKLLMKMGWRKGWGVGPRRMVPMTESESKKASSRNKWEEEESSSDDENDPHGKEKKSSVGNRRVRVAPKDVEAILMQPKLDTKGFGYYGIDPNAATGDELSLALTMPATHVASKRRNDPKPAPVAGHINLFDVPEEAPVRGAQTSSASTSASTSKSKGIKGHAFGIGAFEEEDDDIYAVDNVNKYDFQTGGEESDPLHGWTAPKGKKGDKKGKPQNPNADQVNFLLSQSCKPLTLAGFVASTTELDNTKPEFERLKIPRGFKTFHVFESTVKKAFTTTNAEGKEVRHHLPIDVRSALLGESLSSAPEKVILGGGVTTVKPSRWGGMSPATPSTPLSATPSATPTSTSDMIGPDVSLAASASTPKVIRVSDDAEGPSVEMPPPPPPQPPAPPKPSFLPTFVSSSSSSASASSSAPMTPPSVAADAASFSPFANDPTKNARYTAYLNRKKHGDKNPYRGLAAPHMTEWEKEREKEEFQRASVIYRPMSTTMSSRLVVVLFVHDDDDDDDVDCCFCSEWFVG